MSTQNQTENAQFTWRDFYKELADKLLEFKDRREDLLKIINSLSSKYVKFLQDKKTNQCRFNDIDPFTFFAIFNRGSDINRFDVIKIFKDEFQLKSNVPLDFAGIPVANLQNSIFFAKENVNTDINPLWNLYESALKYPSDKNRFIQNYDKVLNQKGIGLRKITIALYWICPDKFITLDQNTQKYLIDHGIQKISQKIPGEKYLELINTIKNTSGLSSKSFYQISMDAWLRNHQSNKDRGIVENRESDPIISTAYDLLQLNKNIILQGAPGTGKTFYTAPIALELLGIDYGNQDEMIEKYREMSDKERIFFTTFHQSMDYEDFIEGLKPEITKDKDEKPVGVTYKTSKGIFRKVCEAANNAANKLIAAIENSDTKNHLYGVNNNPTVWKVTLNGVGNNQIRQECLEKGYICIAGEEWGVSTNSPKGLVNTLKNEIKNGDIIISCFSSRETDAIGIVTGDYEYYEERGTFPHYRPVNWVVKNIHEDIVNINNGKTMARYTITRLRNISIENILKIIKKYSSNETSPVNSEIVDEKAAVVLIIDEINRGNVSKIFGELITLLEPDKRSGGKHHISIELPYSKEKFSVPSNVYIIGTMNTTDRSTGTIDYAIRRRFAFLTLKANSNVIKGKTSPTARALFDDIKSFIKEDKNHPQDIVVDDLMIGHSYFIAKDEKELKLKIKYEVTPLLKEYLDDGLLTCSREELDKRIDYWKNLKVFGNSEILSSASSDQEDDDDDLEG